MDPQHGGSIMHNFDDPEASFGEEEHDSYETQNSRVEDIGDPMPEARTNRLWSPHPEGPFFSQA